jgi:hypothetical protein
MENLNRFQCFNILKMIKSIYIIRIPENKIIEVKSLYTYNKDDEKKVNLL